MRDNIFTNNNDLVDFIFNKEVAQVFDDMVKRSVPGYKTIIEMLGLFVDIYGQDNTNYYDLGASTGAVSLALGLNNKHINNKIIAVDSAQQMVKKCKHNLKNKISNFQVIHNDINTIVFKNASIIVLNLTLQFIPSKLKNTLINKIYNGLNSGGILVITEKINFSNKFKQNKINELHLNFKTANGYSKLEISKKREALKNILTTEYKDQHLERLKLAGFSHSFCYFQCLNFASFLAIK